MKKASTAKMVMASGMIVVLVGAVTMGANVVTGTELVLAGSAVWLLGRAARWWSKQD